MYYCGWDGGGSKTRVCITDGKGTVLDERDFGPLNLNGSSADTVKTTVCDCIDFMKLRDGGLVSCCGLVIGIAGISNRNAAELIEKTVRENQYSGNLQLMGDQEIALAGAVNGPGAILIAGTGSVCFGKDSAGNPFRSGGFGYLIDDVGSGYAIGRDILIAVSHSLDGRGPQSCLTESVLRQLGINEPKDLITWLYAPETGKSQIAALAPLLLPALLQNDATAFAIAEKASQDLADLVIAAWKKSNLQAGEVALTGSIFTYFDFIRAHTLSLLQQALPQVRVGAPRHSAAHGAAFLAQKYFPFES